MTITIEQYQDAISNALSNDQLKLLWALYNFPNSTASAEELANAMSFKHFITANGQVGKIGKAIANYLKITPPTYYDGKLERPAYFLIVGPYNSYGGWKMVKNLRKALETLQPKTTNNTYLFIWNPKRWDWDTFEEDIEQIKRDGTIIKCWKSGNTKSICVGDRIFLVRAGIHPKGIIGAGYATSIPFYQIWNEENEEALFIDIAFEILLNPDKEPILTLDILQTGNLAKQYSWIPQASGISIRQDIAEELEEIWFNFLRTNKVEHNPFFPSNDSPKIFTEGSANQVLQTRYERNPFARKMCIKYYGYSCSVCNFNFEKHYGQLGKDFIHVHHLTQVATIGKQYEIDPIQDLRPICPNCHAMLHRQNPPLTIEALKQIKNEN